MIKLSIPMIIAMSLQTLYSLADAVWVSGIGSNALAAVGFFFPFFMLVMAFAIGIGVGGGAAVSRRIGAHDNIGADSVAITTMLLMLVAALLFTLAALLFTRPIFTLMKAGDVLQMTVDYATIMFAGSFFLFFTNVGNSILRAEGDAKRVMYAMVSGTILNTVLDPIFIFDGADPGGWVLIGIHVPGPYHIPLLGLGVAGAAAASVISMIIVSSLLFYWLFIQKKTFVTFALRGFRIRWAILKDIFSVGIPATLSQMSMSIMALIMTYVVVMEGGVRGVAIYATGWRVVMIVVLPLLGMATAVVSVAGAAHGARAYGKLRVAYAYSVRLALMVECVLSILIFVFAPFIVKIFTWSEGASGIEGDLVIFLRITFLFYPGVAFGIISGAFFQGVGKGMTSLVLTIFRTIVLVPPFAILFGVLLGWGLPGIWFGLVVGSWIASLTSFGWAWHHLAALERKGSIHST